MALAPIVDIFCDLDDFYKLYEQEHAIFSIEQTGKRKRAHRMAPSEIMTVLVLFQLSHYRNFKHFYINCVLEGDLKSYFPQALSYNRFVEIQSNVLMPLSLFILSRAVDKTGCYFIDSTTLPVCHDKRVRRHKVFKGLAAQSHSTMGWFYGFKLHLIINQQGELMSFCVTKGNVDDRKVVEKLSKDLTGIIAGDKGYLGKKLKADLAEKNLNLVTKVRRNMKQQTLSAFEKFFLSKRGLVETVIGQLKSICHMQHTRHRSPTNFFVNLVGALAAYALKPNKPKINLSKNCVDFVPLIPN